MENEDIVDSIYLKGFNEGYIIAQNMPELAQILANIESKGVRLDGFKAGMKQFDKDQVKQMRELLPNWLKGDRSSKDQNTPTKSQGRDREPDKD